MPTALITGINGQDGSYLAEFLLSKGYRVVGTTPDRSTDQQLILHLRDRIEIVETDLLSQEPVEDLLRRTQPDEVYNLAARASSRDLWTQPVSTGDLNGLTVARLLDGIRKIDSRIRFVQASSSEVFGNTVETPQTEATAFHPRNPYGAAKAYGHWITVTYREQERLFACSSILYNHESPRRKIDFVTRKISRAAAMISLGEEKELRLGRLDARRDWGFAGDYVRAMWLMLQQAQPDDYVIATGETHSVRDFCATAFAHVGLDYRDFVLEEVTDNRPAEAGLLAGNPAKAHRLLGWKPAVGFQDLVRMMVDADLQTVRSGEIHAGHTLSKQSSSATNPEKTAIQEKSIVTRGAHVNIRNTCRVCAGQLTPILSLGEQYVSNFLSPEQPDGVKAPLELVLCGRCGLLQLRHTVPGEAMYQNYWYRSGTNQTMRSALADIANTAERLLNLQAGEAVVDIGCNDGTLLASYLTSGIYRIGFDPAENLAVFSRKIADKVVGGFFEADAFQRDPDLKGRRPKIVTSIAMFYDLEDPNKFVSDIKEIMDPDGLWVVQMSYLPLMLKQHDFGNICHEHLEYYSLESLEYLLKLHGLSVVDVELNDVNGGSFRVFIRNRGAEETRFGDAAYRRLAAERVHALRDQEAKMELGEVATYREFAVWVERIKDDVSRFISEQVRRGKKVAIYGASTKGNVMLQYFGLDHGLITAASERNPDKWGKVTVGTRIPIISEEQARDAKPDYFLVLPWHFIEEFRDREKNYLLGGGRFIVPLPHFTLI